MIRNLTYLGRVTHGRHVNRPVSYRSSALGRYAGSSRRVTVSSLGHLHVSLPLSVNVPVAGRNRQS